MKSIIRLLLISLSVACSQSLFGGNASNIIHHDEFSTPALSALSLQQAQEIKAYVHAAKQLGYTDAQILNEVENAVQMLDHNNGVLALSLKYDERIVWSAIGVLSMTTVIASVLLVYYLLKDDFVAANNPANQQNGN